MQDFKNLKNIDMKKLANDRATYLNKRIAETFEGCPAYCVCYSLKGDKGLLSYGMVDGKGTDIINAMLATILYDGENPNAEGKKFSSAARLAVLISEIERFPRWKQLIAYMLFGIKEEKANG